MTQSEELRLICLELALDNPHVFDPVAKAREYYSFIKEKDGDNVIKATNQFRRKS